MMHLRIILKICTKNLCLTGLLTHFLDWSPHPPLQGDYFVMTSSSSQRVEEHTGGEQCECHNIGEKPWQRKSHAPKLLLVQSHRCLPLQPLTCMPPCCPPPLPPAHVAVCEDD
ncbi:unnamed protein product [Lepidochelys olivacea]